MPGEGWVEAKDLRAGDLNVSASGETIEIDAITVNARYETVYNFSVEDDHNYYVSEEDVLVHNSPYAAACVLGPAGCAAGLLLSAATTAAVLLTVDDAANRTSASINSLSEGGAADATEEKVKEVLEGAKPGASTKGEAKDKIFEKEGGETQRDRDFDSLPGKEETENRKELPNGDTVNRHTSSGKGHGKGQDRGGPTLELRDANGKLKWKIRYPEVRDPRIMILDGMR